MADNMICELCERDVSGITEHHLVPKCTRKRKYVKRTFDKEYLEETIEVCTECHSTIHKFFDGNELARDLYTKELLLENEKMQKFLGWVKKQKEKTHPYMHTRKREK